MPEQLLEQIDVRHLVTQVVEFLPKLGAAVVILVLFFILFRVTRRLLHGVLRRAHFEPTLIALIVDNIYRYAVLAVALVMAADQLGINVTAALAGLGLAGVALGFAAQDSVANVISGIIIFWDRPFVVGDWVKTSDEYGCVSNITLRSTRIRTPRNTYVVIPNKSIIDAVLENYSHHGHLRVDVPLGIAYKEDVAEARRVLLEAVGSLETVKSNPAPDVVVDELGNSSVNLRVRVWIDDANDQQGIYFDTLEASKRALDAAGIQIPFPHLQLFVDNVQDSVWQGAASRLLKT